MILGELITIYEFGDQSQTPQNQSQDPNQQDPSDSDQQNVMNQDPEEDPPEFDPIKKFYLIEKLNQLQARLVDLNINVEELDILLQFAINFQYDTLVRLADGIMDIVKVKLVEVSKNEKK